MSSYQIQHPKFSSAIEKALNRVPFDELLHNLLDEIAKNSLTDATLFQLSMLFPGYWRRILSYVDEVGENACIAEYSDQDERKLYWIRSPSRPDLVYYVTNGYCTCSDWLYSSMAGLYQSGRIRYCVHQVSVMVALAMDEAAVGCLKAFLDRESEEPEICDSSILTPRKKTSSIEEELERPLVLPRVQRIQLNAVSWTTLLLEATSQRCIVSDMSEAGS